MAKQFQVEEKNKGERLDRFLAEQIGETRSQIQKAIKAGVITVNGEKPKVHRFLKTGDKIEMQEMNAHPMAAVKAIDNQTTDEKQKPNWLVRLFRFLIRPFAIPYNQTPKIIAENKDYLIIDKPAGLLVHATEKSTEPTLADWLVKKFPEIKKIADSESLVRGDLTFRPGIVHRLDKDVSGIMLIARNQAGFDYFKKQFQTKQVKKEYVALVHGELPKDAAAIEFEISRKSGEGKMACHPKGSGKGKSAITEYEVERRFKNYTLVKIRPLTGRTNQIRAHFFAINHPIVGDQIYSSRDDKMDTQRLLLHAVKLNFIDSAGGARTYESATPKNFSDFFAQLSPLKQ